jgi:hypothetical protein
MGISEEELKAFITNKENFSEQEWKAMQEMKKYIQGAIEPPPEDKPTKVKRKKSRLNWMQS